MENAIHQQSIKNNTYQLTFQRNSKEMHELQQRQIDIEKQIKMVGEEVHLLDNLSSETIDWDIFTVRKSMERD